MRILLLSASYPPVLGGVQTVAHNLARELRARGDDVRVVTNRYPRSLPANEILDGVPVSRRLFLTPRLCVVQSGRPDLFVASLWYAPTTSAWLDKMVTGFAPDVVNVHFPDGQIPFVLSLRDRHRFRLVVSLHGHEILRFTLDEARSRPVERSTSGIRGILRGADAVTACSSYLLGEATKLEPSIEQKGRVIQNGVDLSRFVDKSVYPHPRPYCFAYGRLTYKKGFDLLIDAFARVAGEYPGVDLLIAGDGEEAAAIRFQSERLGLVNRVRLLGRASPGDVVRLLNGCLFLAMPSRVEPFGIVALEGLAAGKPVLATRVGGLPEIASGPGCLLVEPSVDGLLAGIADCLGRLEPLTAEARAAKWSTRLPGWGDVAARYRAACGVAETEE